MASVSFGSLPFAEQIAFFRAKLNLTTESYLDVWETEHDTAFMVAGANSDALVADFRQAIDDVIAKGGSLEDFRRDFDRIVAAHGWDYNGGRNWRSRVIYETNLRTSFAAGRWKQLQQLKRDRPYWKYVHSDSVKHPRPLHLAWNGLVLHADDPWWHTHFPPNGWGCACTVRALDDYDLRKLGKDGPDEAPPIDMQTVTLGQRSPGGARQVQTPAGVDPGFGYAPGRSVFPTPSAPSDLDVASIERLRAPPGVPPIGAPVDAGLDAAFDAGDLRYVGLPQPQAEALHAIETRIVEEAVEHVVAVDALGQAIVDEIGTETGVDIGPHLDRLRDLVVTHNHPSGASFSPYDISTFVQADVAEFRAVGRYGLYRLTRPVGGWPRALIGLSAGGSELSRDIAGQLMAYSRQLQRDQPGISRAVLEIMVCDRLMLLLVRRFGLIYRAVMR